MENEQVKIQIINYCRNNPNTIFDVELMFGNVFQCDDFDNFRQYVSRAKDPAHLYPVGKGVYFIGKDPTDEELKKAMVDYYIEKNYCILAGPSLLAKYKLIDEEPTSLTIKGFVKRNKAIRDNQIIPTKTFITRENKPFRELLEILSQKKKVDDIDNMMDFYDLLTKYKDEYITSHLLNEYSRVTFFRLKKLLDVAGIKNNVEGILDKYS